MTSCTKQFIEIQGGVFIRPKVAVCLGNKYAKVRAVAENIREWAIMKKVDLEQV